MNGIDLKQFVEAGDGVHVIRGSQDVRGWNGIRYAAGLSAKNVPAQHLSMNIARIPPGGVAYAHIHVGFEVMLYILPHEVFNVSDTDCAAISADPVFRLHAGCAPVAASPRSQITARHRKKTIMFHKCQNPNP